MFQPVYKASSLILGNGESPVGVVTLWSDRGRIAQSLNREHYAALGQLYSATIGLDYLIRNLLANPQIRYLVVTGRDLSRSGLVLEDLFAHGVAKGKSNLGIECWKVKSEERGYIDIEVSKEALDLLREKVKLIACPDSGQLAHILQALSAQPVPEPYSQPLLFEKHYRNVDRYPGENAIYVVRGKRVADAWVRILHTILRFGRVSDTHYDSKQREALNLVATVSQEDPQDFHVPPFMPFAKEYLEEYVSQFVSGGTGLSGSPRGSRETTYMYGPRLRDHFGIDQVEAIIDKLVQELESRSAVASLWDPREDNQGHGSPCLNHIWARVVEGRLNLTAVIRSNDMYAAWPENAFALRRLQEHIGASVAQRRGTPLELGDLVTLSESAHIYDDSWAAAEAVVGEHYGKIVSAPRGERDRRGDFIIEVDSDSITVEHVAPGTGEHLNIYSGKNAAALARQLASDEAISTISHALYLGGELQKAELALKHPQLFAYVQDRPLIKKERR